MKSAEPSMDEILASIRKIISDDPVKGSAETAAPAFQTPSLDPAPRAGSLPGGRAEPGLSTAGASPPTVEPAGQVRQTPSFGRLSEALRTTFSGNEQNKPSGSFASMRFGQSAPASPLSDAGRGLDHSLPEPVFGVSDERSRSIANDMDDILNEPLPDDVQSPAAAPAASTWAVWRTPTGKPGAGAQESNEAPASAFGTAAPSGAGVAPAPPPKPSAAPAAPQMSFGRSSGGFYPAGTPSPSFDKPNRFDPQLPATDEASSSGFGAIVPQRDAAGNAPSAGGTGFTPSPRFEPLAKPEAAAPVAPAAPRVEQSSAKPAPVVIAAMPATPAVTLPAAKVDEPVAPVASAPGVPAPTGPTAPAGTNVPLPPRSTIFSRPLISPKPGEEMAPAAAPGVLPPPRSTGLTFNAAKPATPEPAAVSRAPVPAPAAPAPSASQALDALAAGLAASNTTAPAVPGTPGSPSPAGRSLEDLVTDMVKPMLQRWIDDNMPRIIEKALRSETQGGGQKPPGT